MSESKETRKYLSSVNIVRTKETVEFLFDPAVPMEELSEQMHDYFHNELLEHGGDVDIQTVDDKSCMAKMVIPKSFPRKITLEIFRQLEKESICARTTEEELNNSLKKELSGDISGRKRETSRAVEETIDRQGENTKEADEQQEGPQFSTTVRITRSEREGNNLRLIVGAYLYTGNRRKGPKFRQIVPLIFEYNGIQKKLSTSRNGEIAGQALFFRDAYKEGEKLKVWPSAFPQEVMELDIKEQTVGDTGERRTRMDQPFTPKRGNEGTAPANVEGVTGKMKEDIERLLSENRKKDEELKKAAAREEEMKKEIQAMKDQKEQEEERRIEEEIAKDMLQHVEELRTQKEKKKRDEEERKVQEEKDRQLQEMKNIGNVAATDLIYADIADLLSDKAKIRIEQSALTLREGKVEGSIKKYAETLSAMRTKYTPDVVEKTAAGIYEIFEDLMRDIDLQKSVFSMSKSWVLWDMSKQTYLAEHPEESNDKYTLGNPMEDEKICRQISDRHFGWELYGQYRSSPDVQQKIGEALENYKNADKALQLFVKEPNDKGTLSSIELEVLGGIVRTCMEEKREAEQDQKDLENALINGTKMRLELARAMLAQRGKLEIRSGQKLVLPKEIFAVHADIVVESGGELHLEAGTRLLFDEGGGIFCRGRVVAKGTEKEPIAFAAIDKTKPWKNITLIGNEENLFEHCVITGGGGRYYMTDRENDIAMLDATTNAEFAAMKDGETKKKKRFTRGGGIACINGCENTILRNVHIVRCNTYGTGEKDKKKDQIIVAGEGGGMWNFQASPHLTEVVFQENESAIGGGMCIDGGNPRIFSSQFIKNNAMNHGGGVHMMRGGPLVATSSFSQNIALEGGGIYVRTSADSRPDFRDNNISNNVAKTRGGGMFVSIDYNQTTAESYHPKIEGGDIQMNNAKEGGGVYIYHNLSKWSYDYMRHEFVMNHTALVGNRPDNQKEVFRSK